MTEVMTEDSVIECLRCLFEEIALGPAEPDLCDVKPRDGARLSVDEGYTSSSSQDSDSCEQNVIRPRDTSLSEEREPRTEDSSAIQVVCRGPTRPRNERIRATPYDYNGDYDVQQTVISDPFLYINAPKTPSEPPPSAAFPANAMHCQTPSPSVSNASPSYTPLDSPLSVISSGSPPATNYLSYLPYPESRRYDVDARLDTASSVLLSPEQSDAEAALTEDLQQDCTGQEAAQLSLDGLEVGADIDSSNLVIPEEIMQQIGRVLGEGATTLSEDSLDQYICNPSPDPVQQQSDMSLVAAINVSLLTININQPAEPPKVVLPEPIEELNNSKKNVVRILPKPPAGTAPSPSPSPGSPPPLITPTRRNTHLSGGGIALAAHGPEERALHDHCTLKELNEAQVKVTFLLTTKGLHKTDPFGKTYLHNAVALGQSAVVYWFVRKYRKDPTKWIDINVQDNNKATPLHYACMVGNPLYVGYLCEAGASVNMVTAADGATALYLAAERGYTEIVDKLLKVPGIDVNFPNKKRRTPLHAAVLSHKRTMINQADASQCTQLDCRDVIIKLLNHGANIGEQDTFGETVIHYAVHTQKFDLLQLFTGYGDNGVLAIRNKDGDTALHKACMMAAMGRSEEMQEKFVNHLVNSSAPLNVTNAEGKLPRDLVPPNRTSVLRWLLSAPQVP